MFLLSNVGLSCFIKQRPLNYTYILLPAYSNVGARMLLFVVGGLMASSDDFSFTNLLKIFVHCLKY